MSVAVDAARHPGATTSAAAAGRPHRRDRLISSHLIASDALALLIAAIVVVGPSGDLAEAHAGRLIVLFLVFVAVGLGGAAVLGLHRGESSRIGLSTVDELPALALVVIAGCWGVTIVAGALGAPQVTAATSFELWGLSIALVAAFRATARARYRRDPAFFQNTLIVGAGDVGQLLGRKLAHHPEFGLHVNGFVDDRPREQRPDLDELPILGGVEDLPDLIDDLAVERVVVAFSNEADGRTADVVRKLVPLGIRVDVVPRLFEAVTPNAVLDAVEGLPLVSMPPLRRGGGYIRAKRVVDIVGAIAGLVLTAPLWAIIAWRIKRDSRGPVLFRQTRLGEGMREFTSLKFRTMTVGAHETHHREYIRAMMTGRRPPEAGGVFKLNRDDAVTPVGRWLRKTSLDELPQLINVLRGEMSLVGPRPCIAYELEYFAPHHYERFLVPQGLTGLWQVVARAHATFEEALEMDVAYAHACSLALDLRLLLLTPRQLFQPTATR